MTQTYAVTIRLTMGLTDESIKKLPLAMKELGNMGIIPLEHEGEWSRLEVWTLEGGNR